MTDTFCIAPLRRLPAVHGRFVYLKHYSPCLLASSLTLSMVESLLAWRVCLLPAGFDGEAAGGVRVEVDADFTKWTGEEWREEVLDDSFWMSGVAWEEAEARVRSGLSVGTEEDLPRCLEGEAWVVLSGSPSLDPIIPRVAIHCLCNTRHKHVRHNISSRHTPHQPVPLTNT